MPEHVLLGYFNAAYMGSTLDNINGILFSLQRIRPLVAWSSHKHVR